ncbi:hypothetical protein ZWY2020_032682 [Hordeum vulgare]|nr:hypothetical protein ZWY2020_032682 [Hordeum vulgare]
MNTGRSFRMPATLPIIPLGMLILVMPIYEHLFVPFARGVTGHPNGIPYLQRVGVGVVLSIVSMCIAVIVEMYRKKVPPALKSMSTYTGLLVDLFFWLLAVLSFINFLNYLYWASWYKYVKPQDEDENVDEQQV